MSPLSLLKSSNVDPKSTSTLILQLGKLMTSDVCALAACNDATYLHDVFSLEPLLSLCMFYVEVETHAKHTVKTNPSLQCRNFCRTDSETVDS